MTPPDDPGAHTDGSDESDDNAQNPDRSPSGAKKIRSSRACIACRRMKTRCEVDEALGNACKLCIRARRQCIMQSIPRRRKRKTTERVADLEKKIEHLTTLLSATESNSNNPTPKSGAGSVPTARGSGSESDPTSETLIDRALNRGLLDWQTVCTAFDRYKYQMCQFFPFVVFPPETDPAMVKEQQPLLFFAIVNAATASIHSPSKSELVDMLAKDLALRIMYKGERTLEIIQTLLVHVSFYARPRHTRELNFNQMVHIASTMALDVGLGRRSHKSLSSQTPGQHQLESLASRRAWLGCYYSATSVSIALRHPAFVRWSIYIEECLDILSSDPAALPSDRWLCDLVRLQHISEDASTVFSMDDPGSTITLRDVKVQYQIGGFRQQLERWRRSASSDITQAYARHIEANAALFIHELALHSEHNIDELRAPLRPVHAAAAASAAAVNNLASSLEDLHFAPARIESLFNCLGAIHAIFDAFLSMDLGTLCVLPNLYFVRTGYAARALRKLLTICETQARAGAQFRIDAKDLKFVEYMTSLVDTFKKVHAANNSQVARAFSMVLSQMRAQAMKEPSVTAGVGVSEDPADDIVQSTRRPRINSQPTPQPTPQPTSHSLSSNILPREPSLPIYPANPIPFYASNNPPNLQTHQQGFDNPTNFDSPINVPVWYPSETSDSYMTGIDVLQWFGQDFMFDGVSTFGYEDTNYPPGTRGWQQQ